MPHRGEVGGVLVEHPRDAHLPERLGDVDAAVGLERRGHGQHLFAACPVEKGEPRITVQPRRELLRRLPHPGEQGDKAVFAACIRLHEALGTRPREVQPLARGEVRHGALAPVGVLEGAFSLILLFVGVLPLGVKRQGTDEEQHIVVLDPLEELVDHASRAVLHPAVDVANRALVERRTVDIRREEIRVRL